MKKYIFIVFALNTGQYKKAICKKFFEWEDENLGNWNFILNHDDYEALGELDPNLLYGCKIVTMREASMHANLIFKSKSVQIVNRRPE